MRTATPVRTVKVSETDETYDPYAALIAAIVARAVADAQGETFAPGTQAPAHIEAEAQAWLADAHAVRDLVELCGTDAEPVLARVRRILAETALGAVPVTPQLFLFGGL